MYGIVFFNMSVVLFAYLAYKNKDDMYLKISFILIFLFLSLRYEYGNDYILVICVMLLFIDQYTLCIITQFFR